MRYALYSHTCRAADAVLVIGHSMLEIEMFIRDAEHADLSSVQHHAIASSDRPGVLWKLYAYDPWVKRLRARGEFFRVDWSLIDQDAIAPQCDMAPIFLFDRLGQIIRFAISETTGTQGHPQWMVTNATTTEAEPVVEIDGKFVVGATYDIRKANWQAPTRSAFFKSSGYSAISARDARTLAQNAKSLHIYSSLRHAATAAARTLMD